VSAQKGLAMSPERLDSLTHRRTMVVRAGAVTLTQIIPGVTQQMLYRLRLTPDATDPALSVYCTGAKLSQFEQAMTALFGYRLVGRSQGEGMALIFAPDPEAVAAAERMRLQGQAGVESGIAQALTWMRQPALLPEITRTRCPAAAALQNEEVRRAFRLHAGLSRAQRAVVMAGHALTVPLAALPKASRALLPALKPAPQWLSFYLYQNPWRVDDPPRLAVRVEPSGKTWISCPPLDLAPAQSPRSTESDPVFRTRLKGEPDLEDLEPAEEGPAVLEWLSDQSGLWIMAESLRPLAGSNPLLGAKAAPAGEPYLTSGPEQRKKLAASFEGLTLEEGLDRTAACFGATWRQHGDWVLFQRRSTEGS
jgi:hypothetical protein